MPADSVLIWDFDGTLGERPGRWSGAVLDALDQYEPGHAVTKAAIQGAPKIAYPWHDPATPHAHLADPDDWWQHLARVVERKLALIGSSEPAKVAHGVRAQYVDPTRWRLFPDTVPVLEELSRRGWRHVILSNHVPELPNLLAALGIADRFTAVVNSAVSGYEKPHPEAFRRGIAAAGRYTRIVMVGDNPVADIEGATQAGIPALLVRSDGTGLDSVLTRL